MKEDAFPYEDIVNLPHPVSRSHPQMALRDRAAQFAPFAALSGYGEAINETARYTEDKRELDEDQLADLDARLQLLALRQNEHPLVEIECFVPDTHKAGGATIRFRQRLVGISYSARSLLLADGTSIPINDITAIIPR